MSKTARAAVNLDGDTALLQAEDFGNFLVEDFYNLVYLQEVIA